MLKNEKKENDMIYKERIEKINEMHNEEKKEMISAYEEQIQKINLDYIKSKDKIKSVLLQREQEINLVKDDYCNELKILKEKTEEYTVNDKNTDFNFYKLNDLMNK